MKLEITRRTMMATTAAATAATALPLSLAAITPALARNRTQNDLCLSHHDWLSRRLHDALARTDVDEAWRNNAIKTNTCSGCGVHIGAADHGLIAR
ncbi:twin-arginine translocation signal domain-containing protein [Pseudahrensia aquimaris]|uniref:Twin-arginine translocation signal domain-containing protein n=1 Tax=Pseudahrensia aquimaris TaxID=744461 RepID=A0ABW3FBJ1_9HYPH